jgi:hypothetical protein
MLLVLKSNWFLVFKLMGLADEVTSNLVIMVMSSRVGVIGLWLNKKALRALDQKYALEAIMGSSMAEFARVRASAWPIPNSS